MSNIVIREILASDTFSEQVNKINYNFDQLLLAGGGPTGLKGVEGDLGPIGITGTRIFTAIDIVDKTSGISTTPPFLNPNNYYPVTSGASNKIGTSSKPLRHNDLFLQESDDTPGLDGDIWVYSTITNLWSQTGNNIKGNIGIPGVTGFTEWTRTTVGTGSDHDYLTITPQTGSIKYGLILGDIPSVTEGSYVDETSLLTVAVNNNTSSVEKIAISLGEQGQTATDYAKFNVIGGSLNITAPSYNSNTIVLQAEANIKLTNSISNKYYELNSIADLGGRILTGSNYFHLAPINVFMQDDENYGTISMYRSGKSGLLIQPSGLNSVVLTAKPHSLATGVTIDRGSANIALNVSSSFNRTVAIGAYNGTLADKQFNSLFHVHGNATIGTAQETKNPGPNSLKIAGRLAVGGITHGTYDDSSNENYFNSSIIVKPEYVYENASISIVTKLDATLYLGDSDNLNTKHGFLKYTSTNNNLYLGTANYTNSLIVVGSTGNVGINSTYTSIDKQFTVNGDVQFLKDSTDNANALEILFDNYTPIDSFRPSYRGIILGEDNKAANFNFYIDSTLNGLYTQSNTIYPSYSDVNSSRFNFRTHDSTNTYQLLSITGTNKFNAQVQIASEYNLLADNRTHAENQEYDSFNQTALHIRRDSTKAIGPSSINDVMNVLIQNDSPSGNIDGTYSASNLDFFFTDSNNILPILNYPQARISTFPDSGTGLPEGKRGNIAFYTATDVIANNTLPGNNQLLRALLIDSNQDVTFNNNIVVGGTADINGDFTVYDSHSEPVFFIDATTDLGNTYVRNGVDNEYIYFKPTQRKIQATIAAVPSTLIINSDGGNIVLGYTNVEASTKMYNNSIGYTTSIYNYNTSGSALEIKTQANNVSNYLIRAQGNWSTDRFSLNSFGKIKQIAYDDEYAYEMHNTRSLGDGLYINLYSASTNYFLNCVANNSTQFRILGNGNTEIYGTLYVRDQASLSGSTNIINAQNLQFTQIWTGAGLSDDDLKYSGGRIGIRTSDARLKKNVKPIESILEKTLKLEVVRFNWIESNASDVGLIAQDVDKIFPELVNKPDDNIDIYRVRYSGINVYLIKAIQEQQVLIEEKNEKIANLEERLAAIEKHLNL